MTIKRFIPLLFATFSRCYPQLSTEPPFSIEIDNSSLTTLGASTVSRNVAPYDGNQTSYYLGYREADFAKPFAKFWNPYVEGISEEVQKGLSASPHAAELTFSAYDAADYLTRPGYLQLENGWSLRSDGSLMIAIRTEMGNVTGEMYDWWFSWHLVDSSRYKLWAPIAHRYAWRSPETLVTNASAPTSSRYIGTYSFIDEYIGNNAGQLTVHFIDPATELGFNTSSYASTGIETIVTGRLDSTGHTTNVTGHSYLMHQIRQSRRGGYSRFIGALQCRDEASGKLST
ncbi:Phloretin hydrolase [Lasiodiplodia hormozganensis]|uniref:Phloretin hydrolase n=1 Tax=Lasiodiplodia hormozganensis TaxID=869390 RepID=A0AA39XQT4_9PEZI|nr:Phloretin hydrolase [Lasiodiplodia hormozganensis]